MRKRYDDILKKIDEIWIDNFSKDEVEEFQKYSDYVYPKTYKGWDWQVHEWNRTMSRYGWKLDENWASKAYVKLINTDKQNRIQELLATYWHLAVYESLVLFESKYNILLEVPVCIARADSSLWRELKTKHNYWNVWNNDSWDTRAYNTKKEWFEAIFRTLNNRYLWNKQTIWSLSIWWGWKPPVYATSKSRRNNNVLNCLSMLNDVHITKDFNFRTN